MACTSPFFITSYTENSPLINKTRQKKKKTLVFYGFSSNNVLKRLANAVVNLRLPFNLPIF